MSTNQMVINYVPGEECRVAIVEDGKLEELHVERFANASRVGNIYVGRVNNVEPAIQAAFVDFGVTENGFLHVSDLHPRYFPGEDMDETTERVGHKTPRRDRPPIQHALKRGQEVIVQVLKEGVGTKGPTLTSYLSIPGRFLVMMPQMDKVGVSRKVEDEQLRHQMREILDQLDLPEGFGFILRTAGMERTKTELKRDLAYLQRLWKDMERRLRTGNKPRLLYSESDLLVRSLRDLLTAEITEVVIDHDAALKRAARFMKIVAPRGQAKLLHYPSKAPVFHAFGIEQQIAMIHAREVPLPSGGRLVIDQTEALVAIDVNSGKSRDARDAERNAFQTNIEAVDEICRQLRLRDLGGIVVNDLIDMREARHRREVEGRFRERLKRDRARSTTAAISPFGILEMTRQRMRGSHESLHFVDCPICRGRGLVQKPDSVAADALRDLAALLDIEKVGKVEMVVAPRVAGELLSTKRLLLNRIERTSGKHVDVRVSEAVAVDRITFYAYDTNGNDIDLATLPAPRKPDNLIEYDLAPSKDEESWASDIDAEKAEVAAIEVEHPDESEAEEAIHPIEIDEQSDSLQPMNPDLEGGDGRRRRRRRRRGRGRGQDGPLAPGAQGQQGPNGHAASGLASGGLAPGGQAPNGQGGRAPQGAGVGPDGHDGHDGHDDFDDAPRGADGQPMNQPMSQSMSRQGAPDQGMSGRGPGQGPGGPGQGPVGPGMGPGMDQDQGEIGPDGQRRKRRRRRRGRGRGGRGPDQPGMAGTPGMADGMPGPQDDQLAPEQEAAIPDGPDDTHEWGEPPVPRPIAPMANGDDETPLSSAAPMSSTPPATDEGLVAPTDVRPAAPRPEIAPRSEFMSAADTPRAPGFARATGPAAPRRVDAVVQPIDDGFGDEVASGAGASDEGPVGPGGELAPGDGGAPGSDEQGTGKRRRRRRRRGRGGSGGGHPEDGAPVGTDGPGAGVQPPEAQVQQPRPQQQQPQQQQPQQQQPQQQQPQQQQPQQPQPRDGHSHDARGGSRQGGPRAGGGREGRDGGGREAGPRDGGGRGQHPRGGHAGGQTGAHAGGPSDGHSRGQGGHAGHAGHAGPGHSGGGHAGGGHSGGGHSGGGHAGGGGHSRGGGGQGRGGPRGGGRGDQRPPAQPRQTPAQPPAATPPPAGAPVPRSLYSTRRKLSPSERNKRPKPE